MSASFSSLSYIRRELISWHVMVLKVTHYCYDPIGSYRWKITPRSSLSSSNNGRVFPNGVVLQKYPFIYWLRLIMFPITVLFHYSLPSINYEEASSDALFRVMAYLPMSSLKYKKKISITFHDVKKKKKFVISRSQSFLIREWCTEPWNTILARYVYRTIRI